MATALIVFNQGGPGTPGEAFEGTVAGGLVTVTNDNNTGVTSWTITLLDVPPDSALVPGVLATAVSGTPSASFTPDVPGSYRIRLDVLAGAALDTDIRNFGIRNARGVIVPPYQQLPTPLPLVGPGSKPDEQNYGGQSRGWTGTRTDGQLEEFFATYDDLPIRSLTATPFTAAVSHQQPLYYVDLVTIGASAVFNLPSGARVGQRFRVVAGAGSSNTVTVAPPGGHSIDSFANIVMLSGTSGTFVYRGGTNWTAFGSTRDVYERTLVGGVEDTDSTGFQTIGSTAIDTGSYPNTLSVSWQALIETTSALDAVEIRLYNVTTAAVIAGSVLSSTSLTPVLVSASISLTSGLNIYEAQLRLQSTGTPNRATCKQAQVVISWLQP